MPNAKPSVWRRNIPIWPWLLILALVLAGGYIWAFYSDHLGDLFWGWQHKHTASFEGQTLKVPNLWRQTEEPAGLHELRLETSFSHQAYPASMMITRIPAGASAEDATQRFRELMSKIRGRALPEFDPPFQQDPVLSTRYSCIMVPDWVPDGVLLNCEMIGGGWHLLYNGSRTSLPDVATVLRNLIPLEAPAR